jgi:type II secretion system protein C
VALQVTLGALCGYLAWSVVAAFVWAAPVPEIRLETPEVPPVPVEPLDRYALIYQRDLFRRQVGPTEAAPLPTEEPLEESKLAVKLHGTAATEPPEFSVAAVEDLKTREHFQVRAGDVLQGARVVRIERSRIVVENNGRLEEILLDEEAAPAAPASAKRRRSASAARGARERSASRSRSEQRNSEKQATRVAERVRRLTQRFAAQGQAASATPTGAGASGLSLFRQADLRPKLEGTTVVGLVVNRVAEGTQLESAGLAAGDVITGVNGTSLEGDPQAFGLLRKAVQAGELVLEVERGGEKITVEIDQETD